MSLDALADAGFDLDTTNHADAILSSRAFRAEFDALCEVLLSMEIKCTEMMMATKFGESTTHWNKLTERLDRGVGNPCPLLLVGLPATCVTVVSEAGISEEQP